MEDKLHPFVAWPMRNEKHAEETAQRIRRYLKRHGNTDVAVGICKKLNRKWHVQVLTEIVNKFPGIADVATEY